MIDSTLPGIIKERILKRKFHMTKEELPKVLFNLDKDSLYILEFVLKKVLVKLIPMRFLIMFQGTTL